MSIIARAKTPRREIRLPSRSVPPITVVIRPEVVQSIARNAGRARDDETGEPLIGTVQPSWEGQGGRLIVAVLGSIPPGPHMRSSIASVDFGGRGDGDRAASALLWWRKVTGLDLRHLGDWHKHRVGFVEPSNGDRRQAQRMKHQSGSAVWLTAIAVCARAHSGKSAPNGRSLVLSDGNATRGEVRFYRETEASGLVSTPVRVEGRALPALPQLPWNITDAVRFTAECRLLNAAGFATAIEPSITDSGAGIKLRVTSRDGKQVTITTTVRYPFEAPAVTRNGLSRPITVREWSPTRFLIDLVKDS